MSKWILKLLTGSHQGAEIDLMSGNYTLGSSEDDDLVLQDSALKPGHLHLNLDETSASLELHKSNGSLKIDGKEYKKNDEGSDDYKIPITISNTLSIGTLKFIIGLETENWEAVTLPMDETKINQEDAVRILATKQRDRKSASALQRITIGGIAIALIIGLAAFTSLHDSDEDNLKVNASQMEKWKQIESKFDSKDIVFEDSASNATIKGQVQTSSDYKILKSLVELVGIQGTTKVEIDEEIAKEIELELRNIGEVKISINIGAKTGHLVATGATQKPQELSDLLNKYVSDSIYVKEILNNTEIEESADQPANINIGLRIRSVNLGRTPYFITEDGQIMVHGSKLANGLKVESINTEFIQLTRGEKLFRHQLGGL